MGDGGLREVVLGERFQLEAFGKFQCSGSVMVVEEMF